MPTLKMDVYLLYGQIGEKDIRFINKTDVKHTRVFADVLHLRQVLINIPDNAVKFTPRWGNG